MKTIRLLVLIATLLLQGNELWQRSYGQGVVGNEFWDILQDADGGYVLSGVVIHSINPATGRFVSNYCSALPPSCPTAATSLSARPSAPVRSTATSCG